MGALRTWHMHDLTQISIPLPSPQAPLGNANQRYLRYLAYVSALIGQPRSIDLANHWNFNDS